MRELPPVVTALAARQAGLASRRQLLGLGASESDLRSWLRGRLLTTVEPGVYADHTGSLDWDQRAASATLRYQPAALWGLSAVRATLGRLRQLDDAAPIHVAVAADRRVTETDTIVVHRVVDLAEKVAGGSFPPRMRLEEATLDAAAGYSDELRAIAVIAEVVGSRRTTAGRLLATLAERPRIARRPLLGSVLTDIADGACSVLERRYLREVEAAHSLPTARRQVRASARGTVYRDVLYEEWGVVVELDGRLDHTQVVDRTRDLERDLVAAGDGLITLRLGYGQVGPGACATARGVGRVLRRNGWPGEVRRCRRCVG